MSDSFIPAAERRTVVKTIEHWIAGRKTTGESSRRGPVWNPATGVQQAEVVLATAADVAEAVSAAREAAVSWSQSSLSTRTKILFAFRELVSARLHDFAEIVCDEHGKTVADARGEVQRGL